VAFLVYENKTLSNILPEFTYWNTATGWILWNSQRTFTSQLKVRAGGKYLQKIKTIYSHGSNVICCN